MISSGSAYEGAAAHYLSAHRRDAVKRRWEEPVNHRIVAAAIDALPRTTTPLTVVDIGAGTGDGLALLEAGLARTTDPDRPFRYVGIDPDPAMVDTARATHAGRPDVEFLRGDVRDPLPVTDVDLHLSAGVPYSHLTHDELPDALTTLFAAAVRAARPTAFVVDVLGRYSLEWAPRWSSAAWDYDMSFFAGADEARPSFPMSFHGRVSLERAVATAVDRTGLRVVAQEFHDRSVVVGRHTTTGAFNPGVPNYRSMVNRLHDGDTALDLDALVLEVPDAPAPPEITAFFTALADGWNACLAQARQAEDAAGPSADRRRELAEELCALEHGSQRGLGAGHSLIALLLTHP